MLMTLALKLNDFGLCVQKNLRDAMLQATAEIPACSIIATCQRIVVNKTSCNDTNSFERRARESARWQSQPR
jgi:hypothetical protein